MLQDNHIVRQFDEELDDIRKKMMEMAGLVERQLERALRSIAESDSGLADEVILADSEIDAMELVIDDACLLLLAKRQPAAKDLRLVVGLIRAVKDLERIGDEACKVAIHSIRLAESGNHLPANTELEYLASLVIPMLDESLGAFARLDHRSARRVIENATYSAESQAIPERLVSYMMSKPDNIEQLTQILGIVRSLERVGDHSLNLCEEVVFVVEGEDIRHS